MFSAEEWSEACDELVEELLASADWQAPPVDAIALGQRLRMVVAWDESLAGRGRLQRLSGQPAIFLKPDDRPERVQWAAAHELGESIAWKVCQRLGINAEDLAAREREQLANQLAQRILLPRKWFRREEQASEADLMVLKQRFGSASHELIGMRLLDFGTPKIVTIWDHGKQTRRRANRSSVPPLMTVERRAWQACRDSASFGESKDAAGWCRCWAIHENDWKREIAILLISEPED